MEPHSLMQTSAAIFALAAAGGLTMAVIRFEQRHNPPNWVAMGHGLLAAAGFALLLYALFTTGLPSMAILALVLLILGAAVGTYLNLGLHLKGQLLPLPSVLVHAGLGVGGLVMLVLVLLGHGGGETYRLG